MRSPILFDPVSGGPIILQPDPLVAFCILVGAVAFCVWQLFRA